jgi:hypothetical protein
MMPLILSPGFDYKFSAIQNEDNELFNAYKNMFEMAISQSQILRKALNVYFPIYERFFVRICYVGHSRVADPAIARRGYAYCAKGSRHDQSYSEATHPREETENTGERGQW